jgi:predicted secreted protein
MNPMPPSHRPGTPPRPHWSRHLVRLIVVAAIVAILAYLYSKGVR